jgi:tetratricopeptide (TPR) repeat protein
VIHEDLGHYEKSQELLERRLRLDVPAEETTPLLESHELLACSLFNQGKFEVSLGHADAGWQIYDPLLHNDLLAATVGENVGIGCRCWAALDLWYLGHPDRAVGYMEEAFEVASDPASSYSLSAVHQQAAILYQLRREPDKVLEHATLAMDLARLQGYEFRFATCNILRGWARTELGAWDDGLTELRAGLDAHAFRAHAIVSLLHRPSCRSINGYEASFGVPRGGDRSAPRHNHAGLLLPSGAPQDRGHGSRAW